jgi:hypothetical protein
MPPNRAIGWYRFILRMMPTCIALTTAFGVWWLASFSGIHFDPDLIMIGWLALNAPSTVGIAIFEAKLRNQSEPPMLLGFKSRVFLFFLLQILMIPAMSLAIFFTLSLAAGN